MKKMNWKIVNISFWIEIILSYILPFKVIDNFQYQVGFPVPFLSVYDTDMGISPLISMHFNPIGFLINGVLLYLILLFVTKVYHKYKKNH